MGEMSRRSVGKLLLALPAAGWALPLRAAETEKPSEAAEFLAKNEPGLSAEERERLRKALVDEEKPLKTVREYELSNDVPPALRFQALRSRRA